MRRGVILLLCIVLVSCSGNAVPPTIPILEEPKPQLSLLQIGQGAYDDQIVTVQAPLIQRIGGNVFVPALSIAPSLEIKPLLNDSLESVLVGGDAISGLNRGANGESYGVVRITGIVQKQADGTRQIQPNSTKVIVPLELSLAELQRNDAVYQQQVVAISGTLIFKPNEAILVEAVNEGGIPLENALQIKIAQPFNDTGLIEALPNKKETLSYGPVELVGELRGKTLVVFWGNRR